MKNKSLQYKSCQTINYPEKFEPYKPIVQTKQVFVFTESYQSYSHDELTHQSGKSFRSRKINLE